MFDGGMHHMVCSEENMQKKIVFSSLNIIRIIWLTAITVGMSVETSLFHTYCSSEVLRMV